MSLWRARSLRSRLIIRLVLVQAIALATVSALVFWAMASLSGIEGQTADPRDAAIIADAVERSPDGGLQVRDTLDMAALRADAPDLWFVVEDGSGTRFVDGEVPEAYALLSARVAELRSSVIRDSGPGEHYSVFIRAFEEEDTPLHVMVGGGRTLDILVAILFATNRFLLALFVFLAAATMAIITWFIRREVRAVETVAAMANTVDFDKRGVSLPTDNLPSEIAPLVQAFNAAIERLDRGYARQQKFLAAAAHELKTPIAILQTRIDTTIHGPERARLLMDVARLNTLAEQLLDVQRLDHRPDDAAAVDLVALARRVTADLAPLAIAAGYEITFDSVRESFMVTADAAAVERALTNLVQNAMVHGGGGGAIGVALDRDGAIEVSDQGAGVPEVHRKEIFEPFHRVQPSSRGSGLGLSLVSDVVRTHGGHVSVSDAPGGGSVFRLALPARQDAVVHGDSRLADGALPRFGEKRKTL